MNVFKTFMQLPIVVNCNCTKLQLELHKVELGYNCTFCVEMHVRANPAALQMVSTGKQ